MESWKKTLYAAWVINFLHGVGLQMFTPFLPLYVEELGVADPQAQATWSGILYGMSFLFSALLGPYWGTIGDKYGRKLLVLRTTFGISVVTLLMSLATNVYELLALRIIHGLCAAMTPALAAMISQGLPEDKTGQGLGMLQVSIIAGNITGPFIGGLLFDLMGYRKVLAVVFFFTLIAGLLTVLFIHEPKRDAARPRVKVSDNIKLVLTSPNLRLVAMVLFVIHFALFIVQPILPLFIVALHGENNSATMVGLVFSITGFSTMLFTPYWGRIGDRRGHRQVLAKGLFLTGLSFFPQALVTSVYQLLPLRALAGFFMAGLVPSTQSMIVKNTDDLQRGGVMGITYSVALFGQALGPLAGGILSALFGFRFTLAFTSFLLIAIWCLFRDFINKSEP